MDYVLLVSWRRFGVHKDDFQDVTSESGGELMKADFWGITGELDTELMLSHNQLKFSGSFAETMALAKLVQKF